MDKSFKLRLYAKLIFCIQWLIYLTCFKTYKGDKFDATPCVLLFWHGRLAMMPFVFKRYGYAGKRAFVMISHHKDGEIITQNIKLFHIDTIRGSSSKGASAVLKAAFQVLSQNDDVVITPDGPRGPYHSIADGAVLIASKKNVKIRILNYEASRYWEFKSWDKMILPKPFSRITYSLSEKFDISNLQKDEAKAFLQEKFAKIAKEDSFKG